MLVLMLIKVTCLKIFNFPAKKLRKNTGAQNTHAPIFFKKKLGSHLNKFEFNLYLLSISA